jgi:hypothetical protein
MSHIDQMNGMSPDPIVPQPGTGKPAEKNFRLFERSEFLKFRQG